jgi:glycosyltransferase involved in cell wall biosynthesis
VSVVVPVGGVDGWLKRQITAVLAQDTPFSFDMILSLNSSAARERAALDEILQTTADGRLRVVLSADRRGAAHARNVGARASQAPLLAFCDADDEVHPGWLAALVRGLEQCDAVTGQINELAPPGQESWRPRATPGQLPTFLGAPYILSGNLAITREAFTAVGGFDETLSRCEDIALGWCLLDRGYRLGFAADAVLDYHHRAGLRALMRQHYWYGQGMAEVLSRYPVPMPGGARRLTGLFLLRPNGQPAPLTIPSILRRISLAVGRAVGLIGEWRRVANGAVESD